MHKNKFPSHLTVPTMLAFHASSFWFRNILREKVESKSGSVINLTEKIYALTNAVICRAAFGKRRKEESTYFMSLIKELSLMITGLDLFFLFFFFFKKTSLCPLTSLPSVRCFLVVIAFSPQLFTNRFGHK